MSHASVPPDSTPNLRRRCRRLVSGVPRVSTGSSPRIRSAVARRSVAVHPGSRAACRSTATGSPTCPHRRPPTPGDGRSGVGVAAGAHAVLDRLDDIAAGRADRPPRRLERVHHPAVVREVRRAAGLGVVQQGFPERPHVVLTLRQVLPQPRPLSVRIPRAIATDHSSQACRACGSECVRSLMSPATCAHAASSDRTNATPTGPVRMSDPLPPVRPDNDDARAVIDAAVVSRWVSTDRVWFPMSAGRVSNRRRTPRRSRRGRPHPSTALP